MGNDLNLALASLLDDDVVAEVADAAIDLDLVLQELLEGGGVEDLVASGLLSVDDELLGGGLALGGLLGLLVESLSLLFHAMISLEVSPGRLGQQQSGVFMLYILFEEPF